MCMYPSHHLLVLNGPIVLLEQTITLSRELAIQWLALVPAYACDVGIEVLDAYAVLITRNVAAVTPRHMKGSPAMAVPMVTVAVLNSRPLQHKSHMHTCTHRSILIMPGAGVFS